MSHGCPSPDLGIKLIIMDLRYYGKYVSLFCDLYVSGAKLSSRHVRPRLSASIDACKLWCTRLGHTVMMPEIGLSSSGS